MLQKTGWLEKISLIDVAKSGKRELRETGKLSIKLDSDNDQVNRNKISNTINDDILLSTKDGKCLRFPLRKT